VRVHLQVPVSYVLRSPQTGSKTMQQPDALLALLLLLLMLVLVLLMELLLELPLRRLVAARACESGRAH